MIFNAQQSPIFNFNKNKLFDPSNSKIDEEASKNSFKSKLKKIDKELFNNIPKNDKLMNNTTILHKRSHHSFKDKQYYQNLLDEIYQNESHFDGTNIKKKINEGNIKISSLIPKSKKMINKSKEKFLKEEENFKEKEDILKKNKKHSRRKGSFNADNKLNVHRNMIKRKSKKYNSSHELIKVKKKRGSHNLRKLSEIGKIKDIIKEQQKIKKVIHKKDEDKDEEDKKEDENEDKNKNNKYKKKGEDLIKNKNGNLKEENNNEKNKFDTIDINNHNTKKDNEIKSTINDKNNNKCNIIKFSKNENKNKKKRKSFPFCCLTALGDASDSE
jgi:hypothetical protein